jgi:hypothetical protein
VRIRAPKVVSCKWAEALLKPAGSVYGAAELGVKVQA